MRGACFADLCLERRDAPACLRAAQGTGSNGAVDGIVEGGNKEDLLSGASDKNIGGTSNRKRKRFSNKKESAMPVRRPIDAARANKQVRPPYVQALAAEDHGYASARLPDVKHGYGGANRSAAGHPTVLADVSDVSSPPNLSPVSEAR